MKISILLVTLVACGWTVSSCTQKADSGDAVDQRLEDLKPGLGDIMSIIQQHHAKLYYAGTAQNWKLADYELGEIKEGLEDAAKFHPTFKNVKASIAELIPAMTKDSLAALDQTIRNENEKQFKESFKNLSNSCNKCHQAAEHPFIVIQSPAAFSFPNQKFTK